MLSTAKGMASFFYLRRIREIIGCVVYLLVVMIAYRMPEFPGGQIGLIVLTAPIGGVFLFLLAVFAGTDMDILSTKGNYHPSLYTLPVPTRTLAFWPMLFGVVTLPLVWILFAFAVLVPLHQEAFLWWPAAMLAAQISVLQALSWSPLPLPYLRITLVIVFFIALEALGLIGQSRGWSSSALCAIYLSIVPISCVFAIRGLSHSRTGVQPEWRIGSLWRRSETIANPRLRTPLMAQVWLEWKRNGKILPFLALLTNLLFFLLSQLGNHDVWIPIGIGNVEITMAAATFPMAVFFTTMIVSTLGCSHRKMDTLRPDLTVQPFLATRPISSVEIIGAKIGSFALSNLLVWAVQLFFFGLWLLSPARGGEQTGTIASLVFPHLTGQQIGIGVAGIFFLIFFTFSNGINGLWTEMYGRFWLSTASAILMSGSFGLAVVGGFVWAPSHLTFLRHLLEWLPSIACALVVLKFILTGTTFTRLLRLRLVSGRFLATVGCIWLLIASSLFLLLNGHLPDGKVSALQLACGIILILPIARISLAPIMLSLNRHR